MKTVTAVAAVTGAVVGISTIPTRMFGSPDPVTLVTHVALCTLGGMAIGMAVDFTALALESRVAQAAALLCPTPKIVCP